MRAFGSLLVLAVLASCGSPETGSNTAESEDAIPADVRAAALAAAPTLTILDAERKEREGRVYYDVEGVTPDGQEQELDLLQTETGWTVVEIQRDVPWENTPEAVRTLFETHPDGFVPIRVIESRQTGDGAVIYELFQDGMPQAPSAEVRWADGKAEVLTETWPH
jgi:hypothetical protein